MDEYISAAARPVTKPVSRRSDDPETSERETTVTERFISQCVVCAVILTGIMLVRLISPSGLDGALRDVKNVLAVNITAEQASGVISGAADAVSKTLGLEGPAAAPPAEVPPAEHTTAPPRSTSIGVSIDIADLPDDRNARIDEDILNEIQSEPVYGGNSPN
ncbi:MAG: hypothetical protein LBK41_06410 [Clostridiales bacterium]|jgi:hypothetical protein|nr:hypothetical protein [Clostridiales bacterium]